MDAASLHVTLGDSGLGGSGAEAVASRLCGTGQRNRAELRGGEDIACADGDSDREQKLTLITHTCKVLIISSTC